MPSTIEVGTCVSSCIKVKGFRNVIHWRVTRYDEPKLIEMSGAGRGGVRINLVVEVQDDVPCVDDVAMIVGTSVALRRA